MCWHGRFWVRYGFLLALLVWLCVFIIYYMFVRNMVSFLSSVLAMYLVFTFIFRIPISNVHIYHYDFDQCYCIGAILRIVIYKDWDFNRSTGPSKVFFYLGLKLKKNTYDWNVVIAHKSQTLTQSWRLHRRTTKSFISFHFACLTGQMCLRLPL